MPLLCDVRYGATRLLRDPVEFPTKYPVLRRELPVPAVHLLRALRQHRVCVPGHARYLSTRAQYQHVGRMLPYAATPTVVLTARMLLRQACIKKGTRNVVTEAESRTMGLAW
eukprot:1810928-Rhodomonas_salina.1